jgi:hypothetical protein
MTSIAWSSGSVLQEFPPIFEDRGCGLYFYAERFMRSVQPAGIGCGLYLEPAKIRRD